MNVKFVFPGLFMIIFLFACYEDILEQEIENNAYPDVDKSLWPHFMSFENEARQRGLDIDLAALEISGVIRNIQDDGVAGTCQYGNHIAHVSIDRSYWNNASSLLREYVVFHELGHCALYRGHDESSNNNGICRSIMNSGLGYCIPNYNNTNRNRYLDELFLGTD